MNNTPFQKTCSLADMPSVPVTEPDFSGLDSPEDLIRDAQRWGLIDELRRLLKAETVGNDLKSRIEALRDIAYELAGAQNRDLAVDVLVHVTGVGEFGASSLRDYAEKHGCSHEWFRQEVEAMGRRLGLREPVDRQVKVERATK